MKSYTIHLLVSGALIASALLASCTMEEYSDGPRRTAEENVVPVRLGLKAAPLADMTEIATRGTATDTTGATAHREINEIKNLWILQFRGTADTSRLATTAQYFENYSPTAVYKLVASGSATNRIYFIANTFINNIPFGDECSLAEAKAVARSIAGGKENDIVKTVTLGGGEKEYYPVLNGYQDVVVQEGIVIDATLRHSVARIDIEVVNAIPSDLTIESVTLNSVPDRYNFITDYALPDLYPSAASFHAVDYNPTPWSEGEVDAGNANRRKFTFYVPANKRGVTREDTNGGKYKGWYSPDKATYAFITASYMDSTVRRSVAYSFFLGANLTDDYNLEPNGRYSYTFTIKSKGTGVSDSRVDGDIVDFCTGKDANCYIINPPVAKDSWRNYRIPMRQIQRFWLDKVYEDDEYAKTENGWKVDVIWSEFPIDSTTFQWVTNSKKNSSYDANNDYFEFRVKEGVCGNCVVGARNFTGLGDAVNSVYLWSWHLWVTDYRPDVAVNYDISDDRYVYRVPGGAVHRYNNASFKPGGVNYDMVKGQSKVIMDRNLGAKDIWYHNPDGQYDNNDVLYYQFGRKDPFVGASSANRKIYVRQEDGTYTYTALSSGDKDYFISGSQTGTATLNNNVPYSVNHPLTFIKSVNGDNCWTKGDKYNPSAFDDKSKRYVWQDPEVSKGPNGTPVGKSIFDPCPLGWKVPEQQWSGISGAEDQTFGGFNTTVSGNFTYFPWRSQSYSTGLLSPGRSYYPAGDGTGDRDERGDEAIFFPASGYLDSGSGGFGSVGSHGNYWFCSPYNASNGIFLDFHSGSVYPSYNYNRAGGFRVRCVQE